MKRNNRILSLYKKCEKQEKKELYLNQDEDMKSHLLKLCTPWSKTRLDSCGSENGDEESVSQGN